MEVQSSDSGRTRNHRGGMKPPIPRMKNSHFTCLPTPGLESPEILYPCYGLFFPGWSKTSRRTRTRPGKASMHVPASNLVHESGDQVAENLPLKKRKMEPAFPSSAGISNPKPGIIHGKAMNQSPGPESSKEEKENPRKKHVCDICDRAFDSYQALGGHKSHHNNKAHEIASTTAVERAQGRYRGPVHRCPFCDKVFSKGQALGGHKRHCKRALHSEPTGFRFDLNELPPEWDLEER